jgi:hypothetical protein
MRQYDEHQAFAEAVTVPTGVTGRGTDTTVCSCGRPMHCSAPHDRPTTGSWGERAG